MQDCTSGPLTSGASGGLSHFPLALGSLFLAGGDVWQLASLIQVCSGKMDRNAPLGEDLAFLRSMPARSMSPVPVQDRCTVTGTTQGLRANAANICWGQDSAGMGRQEASSRLGRPWEMQRADNTHTSLGKGTLFPEAPRVSGVVA